MKLSSSFPLLHTVREIFTSHGVPSIKYLKGYSITIVGLVYIFIYQIHNSSLITWKIVFWFSWLIHALSFLFAIFIILYLTWGLCSSTYYHGFIATTPLLPLSKRDFGYLPSLYSPSLLTIVFIDVESFKRSVLPSIMIGLGAFYCPASLISALWIYGYSPRLRITNPHLLLIVILHGVCMPFDIPDIKDSTFKGSSDSIFNYIYHCHSHHANRHPYYAYIVTSDLFFLTTTC